jgi:hypothetical protein
MKKQLWLSLIGLVMLTIPGWPGTTLPQALPMGAVQESAPYLAEIKNGYPAEMVRNELMHAGAKVQNMETNLTMFAITEKTDMGKIKYILNAFLDVYSQADPPSKEMSRIKDKNIVKQFLFSGMKKNDILKSNQKSDATRSRSHKNVHDKPEMESGSQETQVSQMAANLGIMKQLVLKLREKRRAERERSDNLRKAGE